ncbi:6733_t:CDS:1 [Paraglomus occultum]|uniref:6733_t:CDS:1 n=1 Tax=Paraglomus occultum TaxID=144539 RepID=A0A9N8W627_9GLOM|nr:6733_t:CDS:1 [Paraglomus occultum]
MANQQLPPPNSNNIVNHNPIRSPPPSYINSGYENSYDHTSNWLPPTSQYSPNYPTPQGSNYNQNPPNSPPKYPSQYSPYYNQNPSNLPPDDPSLYGPNYNPSPYNPNYGRNPPKLSHRYEPASHFPVGNNSIYYPETAYPAGNHSMMDAPMSTPGHVENRPSTPPAPPETVKVKWRLSRSDKKVIKTCIFSGIFFIAIGIAPLVFVPRGQKPVVDNTAISCIGFGVLLWVISVVVIYKSRQEAHAAARQSQ